MKTDGRLWRLAEYVGFLGMRVLAMLLLVLVARWGSQWLGHPVSWEESWVRALEVGGMMWVAGMGPGRG